MPSVLDIAEQRLAAEGGVVGKPKGTALDRAEYEFYMKEPAPRGTVLDQAELELKSKQNPVLRQRYTDTILSPELTEDKFFGAYYKWLHQPTERATGMWDWMTRVLPKSLSGTAVAMAEFPYKTIKSFTDPILSGLAETVKSKPKTLEEYKERQGQIGWETTQKIGKAAFDLVNGMAHFFGEPIGLYGWEKFKDKWLSDPGASVAAVAPLLKGAGTTVKPTPASISPVGEFGKSTGLQKAYDWIDIQAPFNRVGAKNTGIAFKNSPSIRIVEQDYALKTAKSIQKLKIPKDMGLDLTLEAANSKHPHFRTPAVKQGAKEIQDYYAQAFKRQKADGVVDNPWPKSQIIRNEKRIETLTDKLNGYRKLESSDLKTSYINEANAEIVELAEINRRLKSEKPKYTQIPLNAWYEKIRDAIGEESGNAAWNRIVSKHHKGRFYRQRKTIDVGDLIKDLVELEDLYGKKIFEPTDFDARVIMANYARTAGNLRSLGKIFKSAYGDGLIKGGRGLPPKGYSMPPPDYVARFPELEGKFINDAFMFRLSDYIRNVDSGMKLGRIMGYTKMMAFYNPFFLPIYDAWQSSWAMGPQLANPKYWKNAYKSMKMKDAAYWEAAEGGAFSTPFSPPFENFKKSMESTLEGKTFDRVKNALVERGKNPAKVVDDFYRGVWDMAWTGDNFVRMITNHYLRDKGYGPVEAGQLTAYFHGDYARLTPQARRVLNKIFFTPSFKYVMGHVQANMLKSSVRVMNDAMSLRKPAKRDALMAKGAAMMIAGEMAKNKLMETWGFQTEDWGMRYVKKVETDEGEKELVLYWPDPNNTILRQVHKWSNWGDEPEKLEKAIQKISWDLHPLWKLSTELLTNRGMNNEVIYNMFDSNGRLTDSHIIAKDIAHYSVSRLVAAEGAIEQYIGEKGAKSAYKELQNELGFVHSKFLSTVTLAYLRNPKDIRVARQMDNLARLFKRFTKDDEPKTEEEANRRIDNFWIRLQDIEKQLEE